MREDAYVAQLGPVVTDVLKSSRARILSSCPHVTPVTGTVGQSAISDGNISFQAYTTKLQTVAFPVC